MQSAYLDFNDVTKSYGNIQALKQVTLQIEPGERVAMLGSNGAGKSTFMSLASGIRPYDSGGITIFGEKPGSKTAKQRMRILPQELSFPPQLKVIEILKNRGLRDRFKVILGGTGVTSEIAIIHYGVDAAVSDGVQGVKIINSWLEEN